MKLLQALPVCTFKTNYFYRTILLLPAVYLIDSHMSPLTYRPLGHCLGSTAIILRSSGSSREKRHDRDPGKRASFQVWVRLVTSKSKEQWEYTFTFSSSHLLFASGGDCDMLDFFFLMPRPFLTYVRSMPICTYASRQKKLPCDVIAGAGGKIYSLVTAARTVANNN